MKRTRQISSLQRRKQEHLLIALEQDVEHIQKTSFLEHVILLHNALPEIDRDQVDISTDFLGHRFSAPILVSGMTGGSKEAARINKNIAKACQKLGLGMGLGSMKALIVEPSLSYSYQVRDVAPDIFLAGNIGANDLKNLSVDQLREALDRIGANILAVHLNPAQELVQAEGKAEFAGVLDMIDKYSAILPIYVKEVGQGISFDVATRLSRTKIKAIDVAGAGGTNWIQIEYTRRGIENGPYKEWGIPTALSLVWTRRATSLPIIASGGIRTGEDIVKSLVLGASIAGIGLPTLSHANIDSQSVEHAIEKLAREVGDVMFLIGKSSLSQLTPSSSIVTGKLREWLCDFTTPTQIE